MRFRTSAICVLTVIALLWAMCGMVPTVHAAESSGWKVEKYDGKDYVSVQSIKQFYGFTDISQSGSNITLRMADPRNKGKFKVVMKLTVGGSDCYMNGVRFVFCEEVASINGRAYVSRLDLVKLIHPVLRPEFIANAGNFRTVILDAGHGGKDPGATNRLGEEAAYNLKVARKIKANLEKLGFKVVLTRDSDTYLTLQERVHRANAVADSAVFVSIHFNSGSRSARGIETFTLSPPGVSHYGRSARPSDNNKQMGNVHDSANVALATAIHGQVMRRFGKHTLDRGIKRARFSVLTGVKHPAILLEGGFMSHPYESRLIDNENYQNALAAGVTDAIVRYRAAVSQKSPAKKVP